MLGSVARVAVITTSDCRGVMKNSHAAAGNLQFAASLAALIHVKAVFPEWDGFLATDPKRWRTPDCKEALDAFGGRILNISVTDFRVLLRLSQTRGKEQDHSRGHWPVEAYYHLVAHVPLLKLGYDYTVYVDPDVWFLDDTLKHEIRYVEAIGCVSAIPADCFDGEGRQIRDIHQEYRLVTNRTLLALVRDAAPNGYTIKNSTNSGIVLYNNKKLVELGWNDWLATLFDISPKGFYGDQTALTAAFGRDDVHVHWLPPRFNVALSLPRDYVKSTCGADARYSRFAAHSSNATLSSVHFIWGPKPWMRAMSVPHINPLKFAVQADVLYANLYRRFVRDVLPPDVVRTYFVPLDDIDNTTKIVLHPATYGICRRSPHPCRQAPRSPHRLL